MPKWTIHERDHRAQRNAWQLSGNLAEADKIKIVTAAEVEAGKDRLHGVGNEQRKAIVDGLADSIKELCRNVDLTEEQIMSIPQPTNTWIP